ncbi:uncharacterized protein LOC134820026 [Bolinopsis microptera]|uniref:uncharacterized protein LOC134820026 n=1 Tax=Bolinopsis microptera TaxID=2820187 RepID=UPI0030791308
MKPILCLLTIMSCGMPVRSTSAHSKVKHVGAHSKSSTKPLLFKKNDECFVKGVMPEKVLTAHEIEEEIGALNKQRNWNGRKVFYKIDNFPRCTEISQTTIKKLIDEAAQTWNKVPNANILLVNVDDLEKTNEVDYNMNTEEEFSNEIKDVMDELVQVRELDNDGIDIMVSFEPCSHFKHRGKTPNPIEEDFGEECDAVYAHAHFFGNVHFNELMTWAERSYQDEELKEGDVLKPNLYSIALHEFGHSLGLSHTNKKEDAMFWDFSGRRMHDRLELGSDDISKLQNLYKPGMKNCKDNHAICKRNPEKYCQLDEFKPHCLKTCGHCDPCEDDIQDGYIKCDENICKDLKDPMRPFCWKTCKLCELEPVDVSDCEDGTTFDCTSLDRIKKKYKKKRKCRRKDWRKACPRTCGVCSENNSTENVF